MIVCVVFFFTRGELSSDCCCCLVALAMVMWCRLSCVGIVRDKSHFSGFVLCVALLLEFIYVCVA